MGPIAGQILLQFVFIAISAIFAATEIALISLNENKLRREADAGDKRAAQRLKGPQNTAMVAPGGPGSVLHRNENGSGDLSSLAGSGGKGGKDKDCVVM